MCVWGRERDVRKRGIVRVCVCVCDELQLVARWIGDTLRAPSFICFLNLK